MKKSLVLGAAALAAVAFAPTGADAGEVKFGGYYMFRAQNADANTVTETAGQDDTNYYVHRLELKTDFIASEKTHAHMTTRVFDSNTVAAANSDADAIGAATDGNAATTEGQQDTWEIRHMWLETEVGGFGVKVGEMPVSMNDNILINHDTTAFGAVLLSKTFGDTTVLAGDVKLAEGNSSGAGVNNTAGNNGADDDDEDLYVISVLGKAGSLSYQATGAYWDAGSDSTTGNAANATGVTDPDSDNQWIAVTVSTELSGIDLTATAIYEAGWDNYLSNTQMAGSDFLAALRANGKAGFGSWNAYAFYAGEDFDNIIDSEAGWSKTWDQGGPGGKDLMSEMVDSTNGSTNNVWAFAGQTSTGNNGASMTENMWGIGAGVKVKAGSWTINPMLDYAAIVEDDIDGDGTDDAVIDSMWGGSLLLSTEIDTGTTLSLEGAYVDYDEGTAAVKTSGIAQVDASHYLQASIKMKF